MRETTFLFDEPLQNNFYYRSSGNNDGSPILPDAGEGCYFRNYDFGSPFLDQRKDYSTNSVPKPIPDIDVNCSLFPIYKMKIYVVGSGKLANAILSSDLSFRSCELLKWEPGYQSLNERAIIVHAGSGRQLWECVEFCRRTDSVFIELSTGLETEKLDPDFTLIVCPNTAVLLLKIMNIIRLFGNYFENDKISITESHQFSKKSVPGTAISFARSLKFSEDKIESIREIDIQLNKIRIPLEYLDKHAYHKIVIENGFDEVTIETKVLGHNAYIKGVKKIIDAVLTHQFDKHKYSVFDLIDKKML